MSRIPDFSALPFAEAAMPPVAAAAEPWVTPEGIPVKPVYGPQDLAGLDFLDTYPGIAPYLRGPYPTMYVTQPWTIRQYAGFSTAEDSNAFYRRNLAAGQKGLSVAFDLATHRGYDSDHPRVAGDVGMAGVAIDSIYDMRTLFAGIPLDKMWVSMTMNGAVLPVLALYIVAAEEQGVPPEKLSGTIQNDILKEFMVRNTYIYPPTPSMRIISDIFAFTSERDAEVQLDLDLRLPHAGGRRDAGPRARLHPGRRRRICARRAQGRAHHRPLRAAAVVLLGDRHELLHGDRQAARGAPAVGEADEAVRPARTRARCRCAPIRQTSGWSLTAQDVFNNVARTAIEAMAATQGQHPVAAHQCARRGAGAADRLLRAHRPQHAAVPAAGERHHPDRRSLGRLVLCRAAHRASSRRRPGATSSEVEELGGMAKAIEAGIPKLRIEEAAAKTQARIDAGRQSVIGVNKYRPENESAIDVLKVDNSAVRAAADRQARAPQARARSGRGGSRRSPRSPAPPTAATPICSRSPSMPPAPRRPSARSRSRWRRCSAATAPRSSRSPASIARRSAP